MIQRFKVQGYRDSNNPYTLKGTLQTIRTLRELFTKERKDYTNKPAPKALRLGQNIHRVTLTDKNTNTEPSQEPLKERYERVLSIAV